MFPPKRRSYIGIPIPRNCCVGFGILFSHLTTKLEEFRHQYRFTCSGAFPVRLPVRNAVRRFGSPVCTMPLGSLELGFRISLFSMSCCACLVMSTSAKSLHENGTREEEKRRGGDENLFPRRELHGLRGTSSFLGQQSHRLTNAPDEDVCRVQRYPG